MGDGLRARAAVVEARAHGTGEKRSEHCRKRGEGRSVSSWGSGVDGSAASSLNTGGRGTVSLREWGAGLERTQTDRAPFKTTGTLLWARKSGGGSELLLGFAVGQYVIRGPCVMGDVTCQPDWAKGCPDCWESIISAFLCEGVSS